MLGKEEKIDWADEKWKSHLIGPRKFMWREDTLELLAGWIRMKQGMTLVDVGCGLGYLGYTYWKFFGESGHYFGVDRSDKLISEAKEMSEKWAIGGEAVFTKGEAYKLPYDDNLADIVMCQIVLMHLDDPSRALTEMKRVVKPGGMIVCIEPDNLSAALLKPFASLPDLTLEEELLRTKVTLTCHKGRIKLGRGDLSIGVKLPHMMKELNLIDIDIRKNDRVYFVEPPYDTPLEKNYIEIKQKHFDKEQFEFSLEESKKEFIAGGGDVYDFEALRSFAERRQVLIKRQLDEGSFCICGGGEMFIIKGMKPA